MIDMNVGRPREFDPDVSLESAMQVFWAQGYEATSLTDLLTATGLSRSSLYQTFSSKRQLFIACLEHYSRELADRLRARFHRVGSGRAFFEELFAEVAHGAGDRTAQRGCLVMNSINEFGHTNAELLQQAYVGLDHLRCVFKQAVELGQQTGEINPNHDAGHLADYLLTGMAGLRILVKSGADRQRAVAVSQLILKTLD